MLENKIVVVDLIKLSSEDSNKLHGYHLDYPKIGYECDRNNFNLTGWVLGKNDFLVVAIEIIYNNQLLDKVSLQNPRQDVKDHYSKNIFVQEKVGFSTILNVSQILKQDQVEELTLQAVLSNGNKIKIFKIKLQSPFQEIQNFAPDFLVIGAMKSATSAIYEYMMQHQQIVRRFPKELHFFTLNYEKGLDWYLSQFACPRENELGQKLLIGEASPSYLSSEKAPALISKLLPDVKIIVSLRNPTDRAISHYYHQLHRVKDETRPIELVFSSQEIAQIRTNPHSKTSNYLQLGKYVTQIKNWFNIFPKEQILILNYHDLEKNADEFIKKILTFLELEYHAIDITEKVYSNPYPAIPVDIKHRLNEFFEPYNAELENLLNTQFDWK
ncbi:MAG: sulfotransferase domain-containing protein [Waterburya sp.]